MAHVNSMRTEHSIDTGMVFEEQQEKIWQAFTQASVVQKIVLYGGTGLGLPIVKGNQFEAMGPPLVKVEK